MRYFNASQAARELNVPDKTIRRWLKQGLDGRWKLTAVRTESGQLLISESDVERIKRGREQDRLQTARPSHVTPGLGTTNQDLSDLTRQVADLTAKVSQLEERIAGLESRIKHSTNQDEKHLGMPSPALSTQNVSPQKVSQKRNVARKRGTLLPDGCILASKFAEQHNVDRRTFHDHMTKGLGPGLIGYSTDTIPQRDQVAHETRDKPGRGHLGEKERFLTEMQQKGAITFWHKWNVAFSECENATCACHAMK